MAITPSTRRRSLITERLADYDSRGKNLPRIMSKYLETGNSASSVDSRHLIPSLSLSTEQTWLQRINLIHDTNAFARLRRQIVPLLVSLIQRFRIPIYFWHGTWAIKNMIQWILSM